MSHHIRVVLSLVHSVPGSRIGGHLRLLAGVAACTSEAGDA
jgi:hypothetical protein